MELGKLQKINALASELKKHNFAKTSDDAARLAEQFYEEKIKKKPVQEEKISEVFEEKIIPEISQEENREIREMNDRKFELMLDIAEKKLIREMDIQRSTINLLNNKIENLKQEIEQLKKKAFSSPISFDTKTQEKEVQANLQTKEEKKDMPRSGKYSSADVDIQKMFYYGNK